MSDAATIRRSKHCSALGAWESVARRPAPGLSNMLQSYVGFRGRLELRRELHLPSGAPAVVVNFGAPFRIESGAVAGGDWCDDVSVMGPHDRPFVTETPNDRDILIVNLTPAGAHRLLGAPMSELANRWTPLGDLAGAGANVLSDQLRDARTWDERFGRLEAFLVDRCGAGRRPRRDVSALWRRLSQGSAATVGDVARSEDLSHKHVIQLFREQVGLAPKRVARLARFNRVLRMGRGARRVDWAEVAQACGYFDQAHMINEFRDLAGATPRELEARKAAFTLRAGPAG